MSIRERARIRQLLHALLYLRHPCRRLHALLTDNSAVPSPRQRGTEIKGKRIATSLLIGLRVSGADKSSPWMDVFVEETAAFAVPSIAGCGGISPQGRAHDARA